MLEFHTRTYLDIVHRFGMLLASGKPPNPDVVRDVWTDLLEETASLNLPVTKEHLDCIVTELFEKNPGTGKLIGNGYFEITGASLPYERIAYYAEAIYQTLTAELGSLKLRAIPREKSKYCDLKWLADTALCSKFPEAWNELQAGGRCFAYGENTACIFHLMRVTDYCLRKVAGSLEVAYDARNWQGISQAITKKMEEKYGTKTEDWKRQEPFYAEILTDILAIGRGHRNPALHEVEKKYDEREAIYMIAVIDGFAQHVAKHL
jgi:hypothetical protein